MTMARLNKLTVFYIRESWSSRTVFFLLTMLLLTGFILWGLPLLQDGSPRVFDRISLSIVDDDQSLISTLLSEQLDDIALIDTIHLETLARAKQRLAANEILLIIVIPSGYFEQARRGLERTPLTVHVNEHMPAETAVFVRFLNNLADSVVAIQSAYYAFGEQLRPLYDDDQVYSRLMDAAFLQLFLKLLGRKSFVALTGEYQLNTTRYVISALFCLLALLTALINLFEVQRDRRNNLLDRLQAAGVYWWQPFLARQLAGAVWLAAGFAPLLAGLFFLYEQLDRLAVIAAVTLLYWVGSALAQAWAQVGSDNDSKVIGAWLVLFILLLGGGCIYPLALLPDWLQPFSRLSPAYWAFTMIYGAFGGGQLSAAVWPVWPVLIGVSALPVWLSRRLRPVRRCREGRLKGL